MPVRRPVRKITTFIVGTLALSLLLCSLSLVVALTTARLDLQKDLAMQLPDRLSEALRYSIADNDVFAYVDGQLRADLSSVHFDGLLPVLRQCRAELIRLSQHTEQAGSSNLTTHIIFVDWNRGSEADRAEFLLACELNLPVLISANMLMAFLLMSCWWLLPSPLNAREQKMMAALTGNGIAAVYVRQILQRLDGQDPGALADDPWFLLAMRRYSRAELSLDAALSIATSPPVIAFHHATQLVLIHGLSISLPKTPYFYYAWYALRRSQCDQDGWILNPAADRPDRAAASELITLMEHFGGHQKAINDLKENGLRSKILDQNRNKIKDELTAVLGEELAAGYLFETERDMRSGRHRYRLCCSPGSICINSASI